MNSNGTGYAAHQMTFLAGKTGTAEIKGIEG